MKLVKYLFPDEAPCWQFWRPSSGFGGGVIVGLIIAILHFVL